MAMRAITFSPWMTNSKPLFTRLKILNVYNLHDLAVLTFVYDLLNRKLPHSLTEYCQVIEHNYSTRGKENNKLYMPKCKTTQGQFSISFVGTKLWNSLPDYITEKKSRNSFRNLLSSYLLLN